MTTIGMWGALMERGNSTTTKPATRAVEGRRILEIAARRAGIHTALREALADLPSAQDFAGRLAFYLTADLPHPAGLPLLDLCLRTGLAYYRDRRAKAGGSGDRRALLLEFIAGAFTPLPAVVEIRMSVRDQVWDPLQGQPLTLWALANPGATAAPGELVESVAAMSPRAIRSALAFHLIDPNNLALLPEGALATVVDYPAR